MSVLRRLSLPFSNLQPTIRRRHSSSTTLDDLDTTTKDEIFTWQLGENDFCAITHTTLLRAQITKNPAYATKILAGAKKAGIVDPSTGQPDTGKIGRELVRSMPLISVAKQKELVMLLFFWEEEVVRWKLLCGEEGELKARLEEAVEGQGRMEVEEELQYVQAKKRTPPSRRDRSGRVNRDRLDELPTYEEARRERLR